MPTTADREPRPGILLVHGFWHGAWCWTEVTARLAAKRRRVLAVDLAGHGLRARAPAAATARPFDPSAFATEVSPVGAVDLGQAAELLTAQVEAFAGGDPVVVVAHSASGPVLTRLAQTVPGLVRRAVYLAAFMPATGVPAVAYLAEPEQAGDRLAPLFIGDPAVTGAVRLDVGDGGAYRASLRDAFYGDVPRATADAAIGLLTTDAPAGIFTGTTELTADGWGSVPRTYVHCGQDYAIRPALQRRFVGEADAAYPDNPTAVEELESSHSPFLSHPDAVASLIDAAR